MHPRKVRTNAGAKEGDLLVLTKPLGSGILTTAAKAGLLTPEQTDSLMRTMTSLNAAAARVMEGLPVHACTDITGFGLIGHASEMARGSGKSIRLFSSQLPLMDGGFDMASQGIVPGGAYRNRDYLSPTTYIKNGLKIALVDLMFDPQTSGGLLISLPEKEAPALLDQLLPHCQEAKIVGQVEAAQGFHVLVE